MTRTKLAASISLLLLLTSLQPASLASPSKQPDATVGKKENTSKLEAVDQLFMQTAAEDSAAEIKTATFVALKTDNPKIRAACQRMVRDHKKILSEIKSLDKKHQANLSYDLNPQHKALLDHLQATPVKDLSKDWVGDQIQDHDSDINTVQSQMDLGKAPDVKQFATRLMPTLAKHAEIWRKLAPEFAVKAAYGRSTDADIARGAK